MINLPSPLPGGWFSSHGLHPRLAESESPELRPMTSICNNLQGNLGDICFCALWKITLTISLVAT